MKYLYVLLPKTHYNLNTDLISITPDDDVQSGNRSLNLKLSLLFFVNNYDFRTFNYVSDYIVNYILLVFITTSMR
jgi:hypothetical protein